MFLGRAHELDQPVPMRPLALPLLASLLAACGGTTPPPSATPPAAASAPPAAAPGPCLGEKVDRRPSLPLDDVGTVIIHVQKDSCSIELRASDGSTKPGPPCDDKKKETLRNSICGLGGDVAWLTKEDLGGGLVEMKVGRYSKPDARGDLERICAPFASLKNPETDKPFDPQSLDESQQARVRAYALQGMLTSPQWRLWMSHFFDNREASIATLRAAAKEAKVSCEIEWTKGK